jgi:tyrosyl-tRNA synthetase
MTEKSEFLQIFQERGFLYQATNLEGLDELLLKQKPTIYIGFDCTANSLHVGSLLQIMVLRLLQKLGFKTIVLLGGATTLVGDPSGKDAERGILGETDIDQNLAAIKKLIGKFLDKDKTQYVDNRDWLLKLNYIDFLRDVGRHFSINRMMHFESVKRRLEREQNLSFLEFNYMILQAYDFVELNKKYGCYLQIGGSDQWGNIINGIELNRKINPKAGELFGVTTPLLETADGKKMGKSESGAVWLDGALLSPYEYYQFWRNSTDQDVAKFLKFFTELPMVEIAELEKLQDADINQAKKILAFEATKICHGEKAAKAAEETAQQVFEKGQTGDSLPTINASADILIIDALLESGLVSSKGEARRLIKGNGIKLNDVAVSDEYQKISAADFSDGVAKISAGKKKHALVKAI